MTDERDAAVQQERALLACFLENPTLVGQVDLDLAGDFSLSDHRSLWLAMVQSQAEGIKVSDVYSLADRAKLSVTFVTDLLFSGAVISSFTIYLRRVRELARARRIRQFGEDLASANPLDFPRIVEKLQKQCADTDDWRSIFHSWEEFENTPKLDFAIEGFLQEGGTTFIAGLPGHSKTLVMLAMVQALLDCEPLFGFFAVPRPSHRVLYLIPECTLSPFATRIKLFHLEEHVRRGHLLIRTLSSKDDVSLSDPRILRAARGADVFLDTAVRFMDGAENDVESARKFAHTLFGLLSAGARTITGAHHAPKAFSSQDFMSLENVLRGSGDIGAALCTAWGLRQIDSAKNRIYVQNVKPRDFQACEPFIIDGRPYLDQTGHFAMTVSPGCAGELRSHLGAKPGRPTIAGRQETQRTAVAMKAKGMSVREISRDLGIAKSTVADLMKSFCPETVRTPDTSITGRGKP